MTRSPKTKYIMYYKDSESIPGRRTTVWEIDKVNHRNIVRDPVLTRELWLEMWHDSHPDAKLMFVTKDRKKESPKASVDLSETTNVIGITQKLVVRYLNTANIERSPEGTKDDHQADVNGGLEKA